MVLSAAERTVALGYCGIEPGRLRTGQAADQEQLNFFSPAVFYDLPIGGIAAMRDKAANHFDAIANRLQRNPVLTAMMVTSLIIGLTASIAGVAAWRASSACMAETSASPHVIADHARSDLMSHHALQADFVARMGQTVRSELATSHTDALATCPCAASIGWHWQRI
jgi:hypothetical protein